jgi:glycosyltransferase involved in cell wall biosynthesis
MFDVIFDFSASPVGGGLRRLHEYYLFFIESKYRVLFLIHPSLSHLYKSSGTVVIKSLRRPVLGRLFRDEVFVKPFKNLAPCFFSYGIPLYSRICDLNWFHVSNLLPFTYRSCTVKTRSKPKNWLLARRFRHGAPFADIVSAESRYSLSRYADWCGSPKKCILLQNGAETISGAASFAARLPIAITVGVEPYKRLDRVYEEFLRLKKSEGVEKLQIIGRADKVPAKVRNADNVIVTGFLSREDFINKYRTSKYFISASEVENSSNVVLEAVQYGLLCRLSRIPSHLEMFIPEALPSASVPDAASFFSADYSLIRKEILKGWREIIVEMCTVMGLE